jgi:hypothetical protein
MGTKWSGITQEKLNKYSSNEKSLTSDPFIKDNPISSLHIRSDNQVSLMDTKQDSLYNTNSNSCIIKDVKAEEIITVLKDNSLNTLKNVVPYTFEWNENAETVFVVGLFGNWDERYQMKKINNMFTLNIVRNIIIN